MRYTKAMQRTFTRLALTWKRLDPAWRAALPAWLAGRLGFSLWAGWIWLQQLMPVTTGEFYRGVPLLLDGWQGALLGMWQRWDGIYYQIIVEHFYNADNLTVFFPAYPLLARALAGVTGWSAPAALLCISSLAALFSLVLLYRTAVDLFAGTVTAGRSVERAVLFPSAFFLFAAYPQSLALLWMLLAFRQARAGHWLAAGLAGLLAGLTHGTVLPLAAMLAVQAWQALPGAHGSVKTAQIWLRRLALLAMPALPLLGTAFFLAWREWMGFPDFTALQTQGWNRVISYPWETLFTLARDFPANLMGNWVLLLNGGELILAIAAAWWGLRRLPLALSVYQGTLVVYLLSSRLTIDPLLSFNRFILVMFPMYFALGAWGRSPLSRLIYFAISLLLSLGVSAMFFMWKWIG